MGYDADVALIMRITYTPMQLANLALQGILASLFGKRMITSLPFRDEKDLPSLFVKTV